MMSGSDSTIMQYYTISPVIVCAKVSVSVAVHDENTIKLTTKQPDTVAIN